MNNKHAEYVIVSCENLKEPTKKLCFVSFINLVTIEDFKYFLKIVRETPNYTIKRDIDPNFVNNKKWITIEELLDNTRVTRDKDFINNFNQIYGESFGENIMQKVINELKNKDDQSSDSELTESTNSD
jgi:hypothetical protein